MDSPEPRMLELGLFSCRLEPRQPQSTVADLRLHRIPIATELFKRTDWVVFRRRVDTLSQGVTGACRRNKS